MASSTTLSCQTRLSSLHPYPAMIANELAIQLAKKHFRPGRRFLDPFCGTARTLMASAAMGMECVGIDVNPLAILISRAKGTKVDSSELSSLLIRSVRGRHLVPVKVDLQPNRSVSWFPQRAELELRQIVTWLNISRMSGDARIFLAVLLSATTREVSYCRKGQWKLHRMSPKDRGQYSVSAWDVFTRRLSRAISELESETMKIASTEIVRGDCTLLSTMPEVSSRGPFDLLITSPPYGDSRTTVSYGDVSSLCLGVLQHVQGIRAQHVTSRVLDNTCLGGQSSTRPDATFNLRDYWAGGRENEARTRSQDFLVDLGRCCREISSVLTEKADAIFIVSRRSAGGRRLYIDEFLKDSLAESGFRLKGIETRRIACKMTPTVVNARGASDETVRVNTMREEMVLSFTRC